MKREGSGDQKKYVIEHFFVVKKCAMKILSEKFAVSIFSWWLAKIGSTYFHIESYLNQQKILHL